MRIIGIVAVMLILVSVSSGYWWDTEKILQGREMIKVGGPWLGDDAKMYFGDGKDASIFFNSLSGAAEVVGLTAVNNLSIEMETGEDITFVAGDSKIDLDAGTGITSTTTGVNYLNGNVQVPSDKTVKFGGVTTAANIKSNATMYAVTTVKSGGLATLNAVKSNSTVYAVTTLNSGGAATLNSLVVNTTAAVTGLMSANGGLATGVNASTSISTVLTSASTKTVYDISASAANVTLTLPDAATVPGRMYFISVSGNPGNYYARITATGGDDINANNYLVSTDQWSTAVIVASNGAYRALTSGTWTAHA